MQLARHIEAETRTEEEDDDEARSKKGLYGLYTRQPKTNSAAKWATGLGQNYGSGQPATQPTTKLSGSHGGGSNTTAGSTQGPVSKTMA